eukprot:4211692-Amphidinium_carterae.1
MTSGCAQGDPLSPLVFVLTLDVWVRWVISLKLPPPQGSLYADDMAWLLRHWRDVLFLLWAFDILADVANLRLNVTKCRILPVGFFDVPHWRVALQDAYTVGHRIHLLQIVDHVKYLGVALSKLGGVPFDYFTAQKLTATASMLSSLWAGGVRNVELLGVVLEGMVRYPLSMSPPSALLEAAWQKSQRILSITSLGVNDALHVLPEMFAWPRR